MTRIVFPPLEQLDLVALDSRKLGVGRLAAACVVILLVLAMFGQRAAGLWGAGVLAAEGWMWLATGPHARGRPLTRWNRLGYMASALSGCSVWLALSVMFWNAEPLGGRFLALLVWAALLANAISFAFRSPLAFGMFTAPVCAVMVASPLIWPKFTGPVQLATVFGVCLFTIYAALSGGRNISAARLLARTTADLERARAAAEAANAAKSEFLATMSHEIRTPLNGVIGMAQAMAREDLPQMQRERLAVIRQGGETLLRLLNDLLDLSRIEAGRLELEDGVIDMAAAARDAQDAFMALAADKDIHFVLDIAPQAAGAWRGDPTRVRQILFNLVSNAVKFTARGAVRVALAVDGADVVATVADTGPGIPAERLGALFEKFVQADASTTRQYGGSGLGLAICRELAELMGGTITAASVGGEGSTFTLRLPLRRAERAAPAAVAALAPADEAECEGLKVLAAEDNPMNQTVLRTLLEQLGVSLEIVGDGAAAVRAAACGGWDLILMDVQMPVMDGPSAARAIRAEEATAGAPRVPILALTANAMAHHQAEYAAAGMDGFVAKPIQVSELVAAMERVLDGGGEAGARAVRAVGS
ncbi:ATP-binding protein [Caulobacter sp. KR2-114]|uniref:ATP-binding protein n=1 Tax=Caulobacter sp. KR2-114 TaxID=3400912 RepID=UPI003C10B118